MLCPDGKGEAVVYDKLHDHFDHVPVWQQTQKLAGRTTVSYDIISCCEINNTAPAFFFANKVSQFPESAKLFDLWIIFHIRNQLALWEKRVHGGLDTGVDMMLKDFEGDTQKRDGSIALRACLA